MIIAEFFVKWDVPSITKACWSHADPRWLEGLLFDKTKKRRTWSHQAASDHKRQVSKMGGFRKATWSPGTDLLGEQTSTRKEKDGTARHDIWEYSSGTDWLSDCETASSAEKEYGRRASTNPNPNQSCHMTCRQVTRLVSSVTLSHKFVLTSLCHAKV